MGVLELYLVFMISVGFWSCYELMRPALQIMKTSGVSNVLSQNVKTAYFVQFCIGTALAPVVAIIILHPGMYAATLLALTSEDEVDLED